MRRPEKGGTRRGGRATALVVAIAVLAGSGLAYRMVASSLGTLSGTVTVPRGALAALPLNISDWIGQDVPLDDRVVRATDTDDHLHRIYTRTGDGRSVFLFLAYGVRLRDLLPHRPEVCYPAAGWTLSDGGTVELLDVDQQELHARLYHFSRGGLNSEHLTVMSYYLVDGTYCADVSLLRSRSWRRTDPVRYVVQVQVASVPGFIGGGDTAGLSDFVADSASSITALLTEVVDRYQHAQSTLATPLDGDP